MRSRDRVCCPNPANRWSWTPHNRTAGRRGSPRQAGWFGASGSAALPEKCLEPGDSPGPERGPPTSESIRLCGVLSANDLAESPGNKPKHQRRQAPTPHNRELRITSPLAHPPGKVGVRDAQGHPLVPLRRPLTHLARLGPWQTRQGTIRPQRNAGCQDQRPATQGPARVTRLGRAGATGLVARCGDADSSRPVKESICHPDVAERDRATS